MDSLDFFVAGLPVPQGSMKAFVLRSPSGLLPTRAVMTSDNQGLKGWRLRIAHEAQLAMSLQAEGAVIPFLRETALLVHLSFVFLKPKSTPKRVSEHIRRPDLDKLTRAAFDAMTGVVWTDDAQVCALGAWKSYGQAPGLHVIVERTEWFLDKRPDKRTSAVEGGARRAAPGGAPGGAPVGG